MAKKALLMILDGWGIGKHGIGDVIYNTPTPYLDYLTAVSAHSQLRASGEDVGLPDGQMGNSEVGHLNIGAGRIVYQDLVKINRACKDGSIMKNPEVVSAYSYAQKTGKKLHLMGLTSDGGVHSSLDHLFKLIEIGKEYGLQNMFVHCFMDGRDTDPKSGAGFIEQLDSVCRENGAAIASIVGRFYAMDRDKRWDRVKEAYDLLVEGKGKKAADMVKAMEESYAEGVTDEFIKPISNSAVNGTIEEGDVVIFFNYRNDRAKELSAVLSQQDMPEEGMHTVKGLQFYCMTPYDANFKDVHILFPKENVEDTLGEYLSKQGKKQLHTAETEKYAHVTFFFNGGREKPFEGEDRILVPSPKVATYDLKPEMSAYEVKDKLVAAIDTQEYDFIVVNFANGDMVGHTGIYNAIAKAVHAVDNCVREVIETAKKNGYEAIIIADHGNADNAVNEDGTPNTAHSLNPVPFIYVTDNNSATVKDGRLADVAPSILHIMGLEQPADMTGENLIEDNLIGQDAKATGY
jgi:2,3-bisphosphoglycerate-independent phosphoglycerate mutase